METDTSQGPMDTKRSREEVMEYLPELPTKKLQVSKEDSQQNLMVEAAQQPRQPSTIKILKPGPFNEP